jgi:phosphopantothenoylcysteine decarboxylase / phosphopantothenate---cysteine ligase
LHGLRAMSPQDMAGQTVMITLGPTREKWDGVRFWSNPSSGTMGASFAVAAWLRGADVHAICGAGTPELPSAITRHDVTSAAEMYQAADSLWKDMSIGVFTAAVADYAPVPFGDSKFKKGGDDLTVSFTRTVDILKTLGNAKRDDQRVIGFAAETDNIHENVKKKLAAKNADIVVGNNVAKSGSGFGSATNEVCIVDRNGRQEDWPVAPKPEVAWRVFDWLLQL